LPECDPGTVGTFVTIRDHAATLRVQAVPDARCEFSAVIRLTVEDRSGEAVYEFMDPTNVSGAVLPRSDWTVRLPLPIAGDSCGAGGPFVAVARVGPLAGLQSFPAREIGCPATGEQRVERARARWLSSARDVCARAEAAGGTRRAVARALDELRALPRPTPVDPYLDRTLETMTDELELAQGLAPAPARLSARHATEAVVGELVRRWGVTGELRCPA
jgi:hypothetical protein